MRPQIYQNPNDYITDLNFWRALPLNIIYYCAQPGSACPA